MAQRRAPVLPQSVEDGNACMEVQNHAGAVVCYTRALAECENDKHVRTFVFSNRAHAYLSLQNFEAALVDSNAALQLNAQWVAAIAGKATALMWLSRFDEALETVKSGEAIASTPEHPFHEDFEELRKTIDWRTQCRDHLMVAEEAVAAGLEKAETVIYNILTPNRTLAELHRFAQMGSEGIMFLAHLRRTYWKALFNAQCADISPEVAQRLSNPLYLPTRAELLDTFRCRLPAPEDWTPLPANIGVIPLLASMREMIIDISEAPGQKLPEELSLKQAFNLSMGAYCGYTALGYYAGQKDEIEASDRGHDLLTQEMIDKLAAYLAERCTALAIKTPILEVGAGSGRLAHFLNATRVIPVPVVASDVEPADGTFALEQLDQAAALRQYRPALVLCVWMPGGEDWTAAWRQFSCVREYVLVGEAETGNCGDRWSTFGIRGAGQGAPAEDAQPPYEKDCFQKVYVDEVSRYLINATDSEEIHGTSRVVSFRGEPRCFKCVKQGVPLSNCGRCGLAAYCSKDCQKQDWPVHKARCPKTS